MNLKESLIPFFWRDTGRILWLRFARFLAELRSETDCDPPFSSRDSAGNRAIRGGQWPHRWRPWINQKPAAIELELDVGQTAAGGRPVPMCRGREGGGIGVRLLCISISQFALCIRRLTACDRDGRHSCSRAQACRKPSPRVSNLSLRITLTFLIYHLI